MKNKIITLTILTLIFLTGCNNTDTNQTTETNTNIQCNTPYIRYATECCLDQNNNNICDQHETNITNNKKITEILEARNLTTEEQQQLFEKTTPPNNENVSNSTDLKEGEEILIEQGEYYNITIYKENGCTWRKRQSINPSDPFKIYDSEGNFLRYDHHSTESEYITRISCD